MGVRLAGIAAACCAALLVAGVVWQGGASQSELQQKVGISTPGIQVYEVPQHNHRGRRARAAPTQSLAFQSKAQVAMGAVGGSDGRWPVPPAPPPTWTRGGNSWVYDHTYGVGQRPTTGVWAARGTLPPSSQPPPQPEQEVVEEVTQPDGSKEDIVVPASEVPQQEAPPMQQPAAQAPPAQPVVEEVELPNGKVEEIEEVK
eukprot:CAMPEP_0173392254 /NCGR_PEP_ID=MMETSP1356-20130122/18853_1 /TAXON_ID=77927 ORGANISM="Hemiselmis virescens, Strain PCC157" /NCGR_SAMPLE_ID=MMETSP1356 /ASSEMBLY_ACC=CAM_ASM_000847 /LENGTH=200 /DNA_ID=CAMNT_0014350001 /DNA_START=13 /DNA_END=612 /DNA_ORIENTATION=-